MPAKPIRIGGVEFEARPASSGCGSCIPCVSKNGAPCVRGHRRGTLDYRSTPELAGARAVGGQSLPPAQTPRAVLSAVKAAGEVPRAEVWRDAAPIGFEPCRAHWCPDLDLHEKHERRRRRAS